MSEIKSCGVLLLRGDPVESFLLMRHAERWDFPKGHVDPGETEIECALREMEEETGIPRELVQLDTKFRYATEYEVQNRRTGGERRMKTLVIFLGRLLADHPITHTEHLGSEWFPWNPPHSIQQRAIDPVLADAAEYLNSLGND